MLRWIARGSTEGRVAAGGAQGGAGERRKGKGGGGGEGEQEGGEDEEENVPLQAHERTPIPA